MKRVIFDRMARKHNFKARWKHKLASEGYSEGLIVECLTEAFRMFLRDNPDEPCYFVKELLEAILAQPEEVRYNVVMKILA